MKTKHVEIPLDLSKYESREDWLAYAKGNLPRMYMEVGAKYLDKIEVNSIGLLLFQSFLSRARGLHEGALREISKDNPNAVFPINRAYAELICILIYCNKRPYYIDVLMGVGANKNRGKKSFQAIFDAISDVAPGMKAVYKGLSEYSHFDQVGIYSAHTPDEKEEGVTRWTDIPHWRSEADFRVACSQLAELHTAFVHFVDEFGALYLLDTPKDMIIGTIRVSRADQ